MLFDSKCGFALCKYSTGLGLVTNVNKKNKTKAKKAAKNSSMK